MRRQYKFPKYTFIKGNSFYFSRSVPTDLRCFYTKPRIIQSLRTNSLTRAKTASKVFASKLDDYWLGLRLKTLDVPAAHLLITDGAVNDSELPTIEEALKCKAGWREEEPEVREIPPIQISVLKP